MENTMITREQEENGRNFAFKSGDIIEVVKSGDAEGVFYKFLQLPGSGLEGFFKIIKDEDNSEELVIDEENFNSNNKVSEETNENNKIKLTFSTEYFGEFLVKGIYRPTTLEDLLRLYTTTSMEKIYKGIPVLSKAERFILENLKGVNGEEFKFLSYDSEKGLQVFTGEPAILSTISLEDDDSEVNMVSDKFWSVSGAEVSSHLPLNSLFKTVKEYGVEYYTIEELLG